MCAVFVVLFVGRWLAAAVYKNIIVFRADDHSALTNKKGNAKLQPRIPKSLLPREKAFYSFFALGILPASCFHVIVVKRLKLGVVKDAVLISLLQAVKLSVAVNVHCKTNVPESKRIFSNFNIDDFHRVRIIRRIVDKNTISIVKYTVASLYRQV